MPDSPCWRRRTSKYLNCDAVLDAFDLTSPHPASPRLTPSYPAVPRFTCRRRRRRCSLTPHTQQSVNRHACQSTRRLGGTPPLTDRLCDLSDPPVEGRRGGRGGNWRDRDVPPEQQPAVTHSLHLHSSRLTAGQPSPSTSPSPPLTSLTPTSD